MRTLFTAFRRTVLGLAALLAMTSAAQAVVNNYGNLIGPNVSYLNIVENTSQLPGPDPQKLFDTPVLAGDTLTFSPVAFNASASNGDFRFTDGRLSVDITPSNATTGSVNALQITEGGAWSVGLGGANAANVVAKAALIINGMFITGVNGQSVNPIQVPLNIVFSNTLNGTAVVANTTNGISFTSAAPGTGTGNGSWNAVATANLASLVPQGSRITRVTLDLDNQLTATSVSPSSFAFIDKKFFNVAVPEPGSVVLAGLGGLGLAAVGYRGRKASKVA